MSDPVFINMDAAWLLDLANAMEERWEENQQSVELRGWGSADGLKAKLLSIATNLQSLDDKSSQQYQLGRRDMEAEIYGRSNVLSNPEGEDATGAAILRQIERHSVTKVPMGYRALDDVPHKFNSVVRKPTQAKPKTEKKPIDLDLDLDF